MLTGENPRASRSQSLACVARLLVGAGALLAVVACSSSSSDPAPTDAGGQGGGGMSGGAQTGDPNFHVYLLFGQSNMEGMAQPEPQDRKLNERVKVLSYDNCSSFARKYNQWYTALPPLHGCFAGVGPGDYFGKAMADAYPAATIGLVPCAIAGVDIAFFRKGVVSERRGDFRIPPDDQLPGAYEWLLERARLAQQMGVIKGILFHQGESDTGRAAWLDDVQGIVSDLRADLGIGEVPFVAGELLYGGCCDAHNPIIAQIPERIPNSFVVSADGLAGQDDAHFDLAGQRELGARYAEKMLGALQ